MASSKYEVASQSCVECRANTIQSFVEGTNESDICGLFYDDFIKGLFTKYPWTFAKNKVLLSKEDVTPSNGWQYSHIVPADALMVWAVYDSVQTGAEPMTEFEMFGTASGRRIYSNSQVIMIDRTFYVPEAAWPFYFVMFAVIAFAHKICTPLTHNSTRTSELFIEAYGNPASNGKGGLYGDAMRIDAMQDSPKQIQSNPLVEARFS